MANMTGVTDTSFSNDMQALVENVEPSKYHKRSGSRAAIEFTQNFMRRITGWNYFGNRYHVKRTKEIDDRFRVVYYVSFIVFNVFYWVYYLLKTKHTEHSVK